MNERLKPKQINSAAWWSEKLEMLDFKPSFITTCTCCWFHQWQSHSKSSFWLQIVLIALLEVSNILAFSFGPPLSTCEYMLPHHHGSKAQTGLSPYNITVSNNSYSPGDNLTVSIYGTKNFTGFMLQAQSINGSVAWPLGEFMDIGDGM